MADWIDEEHAQRQQGHHRPLLQSQHQEVNARYPGCTLEYCCDCGQPTGRAGKGEDSLYTEDDEGPFCWDCWSEKEEPEDEDAPCRPDCKCNHCDPKRAFRLGGAGELVDD